MTKYLIQKITGRIYVSNPLYVARGDMLPYEMLETQEPSNSSENMDSTDFVEPKQSNASDLFNFDTMTKAQLEAYASECFDVDLDLRKSKASLIEQVTLLESEMEDIEDI